MYITETEYFKYEVIKMQSDPRFFYKSYLELDCSNMVSILSFDTHYIKNLLNEENQKFFDNKFPIIYAIKMKSQKHRGFEYTNAVEVALKRNQLEGVKFLLDYIVKYQNNFISSFLLNECFPNLLRLGINLENLFSSNVF